MSHAFLSISEAAARIQSGKLQPRDLLESCLEQIAKHDDRIRAWVMVDAAGARREADRLQRELETGQLRGPLHGIPLGIKDLIDVAGVPTKAGSPTREDHMARADAPLVAALRQAGAIILGKTVTVEFACFDPSPTRNPWDPALGHSPGGSSSGSAAAVAAGMCPGAVGTQTGGSLVRPASYCGVAACKPTYGSISTEGVVPLSHHLDHPGPIARTVNDLELMLAAMMDLPHQAGLEMPAPPRLGLVETFFMERADTVVVEATEEALEKLRAAGAAIEPVPLRAEFDEILDLHLLIMAVEAAAYHRVSFAAHRALYGPRISDLLEKGLEVPGVDYADALAHQRHFQKNIVSVFDSFDALICPATDTTAPPTLETTGSRDFQAPWSYAGVPVVSLPCGLGYNGLPVALQLVAPPHRESSLLRVARWVEACLAFCEHPPLLADG